MDRNIVGRPGFKERNVKAYVNLSADGRYIDISRPTGKVSCPDIGALALGTEKCNILVEKLDIVLSLSDKYAKKSAFFLETLEQGAAYEPLFDVVLNALRDGDTLSAIYNGCTANKIKPADVVGFIVDGQAIEQSTRYLDWWSELRYKLLDRANADTKLCFITGESSEVLDTVPKIDGLFTVGGHAAGDALICFDKAAFTSYNLKAAHNAYVSEDGMNAVNSALTELLKKARIHAGSKFVHWYKESEDASHDVMYAIDFGVKLNESDDEDGEDVQDDPKPASNTKQKDKSKPKQPDNPLEIQQLLTCIQTRKKPYQPHNRYYVLLLSGAGGRVMIRGYMQGSCDELWENYCQWFDDLTLVLGNNHTFCNTPGEFLIYTRLVAYQRGGRRIGERIGKELSGLASAIKYAIINGTALPDTVASRALSYIRHDMLASDDSNYDKSPDPTAVQILKAWLLRKFRARGEECHVCEKVNEQNPSVAYHCGRLMAVYATIQKEALGDVGAGVVQRYYTSAATSPALVIGRLSMLSQHHLNKIEEGSHVVRYDKMLTAIYQALPPTLPTTLTLEEQAQFAIGYHHQLAEIFTKKNNPPTKENTQENAHD